MNLAKRTLGGIFWAYASYIAGRLGTLLSTVVLARLLVPEDFGLVAFALIVMNFLESIRGVAIGDALIYHIEDDPEETANTAFIFNVGIGLAMAVIAFFFAPAGTQFIDDPRVINVVRLMCFTLFIDGFGMTHEAIQRKDLQFKQRFIPDLLATLIKSVSAIILAALGFGVWSLVYGQIIGSFARVVARWWVVRWIPRLRFSPERAQTLWSYGSNIIAFSLLETALEQADQMWIGGFLGAVQLGYYAIAVRIPEMVIANFSLVLTQVLFPAFAKMKNDLTQLTNGFLTTSKYTGFVTMPAGFGMAAVAPELILVFFGDQWEPAIVLLQVLALLGTVNTLMWSAGDVLKALGRPDVSVKLLVVEAAYTFPLIFVMVFQFRTAVSASLANLIALCITAMLRLFVISYFLKIKPIIFVTIFRSAFLASILMFLGVTVWREVASSLPDVVILATSVLMGGAIYALILWLLEKDDLMKAKDLVRSRGDDDDDDDDDDENQEASPLIPEPKLSTE